MRAALLALLLVGCASPTSAEPMRCAQQMPGPVLEWNGIEGHVRGPKHKTSDLMGGVLQFERDRFLVSRCVRVMDRRLA